jgi:hypothetical protein
MNIYINFRGKRIDNDKWVVGDLIHTPSDECRILWFELKGEMPLDVDYNSFNELVDKKTVGLMSNCSSESNYQGSNSINCDFKVQLIFDGNKFYFQNLQKGSAWKAWHTRQMYSMDLSYIRKIGNIYDNPELLQ